MNFPEENENNIQEENAPDPRNDIDTVVSNNENIEPVPDQSQLDEKKDGKNQH